MSYGVGRKHYVNKRNKENETFNYAQAFAAKVESGATGISSAMQNSEFRMQNAYNLAGQKVSSNFKGIVIKNAKKVMVK